MPRICIEDLQPGMVLTKGVIGADGSEFLQSGTTLTPIQIRLLRELDAPEVQVASGPGVDDEKAVLTRVEEYVRRFFVYVDQDNEAFTLMFHHALQKAYDTIMAGGRLPCLSELRAAEAEAAVEAMADLFPKEQGSPEKLVKHETELASFPDIYFKLKEAIEDPDSSAEGIAKVVSTDMGLAAKLIKLVNSPIFGFSTKVTSVSHAVSLVGVQELATLALGISAINFFKDIPPQLIDQESFWRHSLGCAVFAKLIGAHVADGGGERFFTAGLLHDAGRLVMFKNLPYGSSQAMLYAREMMVPLVDAEKEVIGFEHHSLGGLLFAEWDFPEFIVDVVGHHHDPANAKDPVAAAVIQLADNLSKAQFISSGEMYVLAGMDRKDWDALNLTPDTLEAFMLRFEKQFEELREVFI